MLMNSIQAGVRMVAMPTDRSRPRAKNPCITTKRLLLTVYGRIKPEIAPAARPSGATLRSSFRPDKHV